MPVEVIYRPKKPPFSETTEKVSSIGNDSSTLCEPTYLYTTFGIASMLLCCLTIHMMITLTE